MAMGFATEAMMGGDLRSDRNRARAQQRCVRLDGLWGSDIWVEKGQEFVETIEGFGSSTRYPRCNAGPKHGSS
jgi:hypothetical protein